VCKFEINWSTNKNLRALTTYLGRTSSISISPAPLCRGGGQVNHPCVIYSFILWYFILYMDFNLGGPTTYGSWIYNYPCNQCLSPLDSRLCGKVCQWLTTGHCFFLGTPVSSTNKTDHHDITEILLKVALNTITLTLNRTKIIKLHHIKQNK
jgi:hypothetical protein